MPPEDDDTGTADESVEPVETDVSAYVAKISQLESALAEKDAAIADLGNQLTAAKAANYDLLMNPPIPDTNVEDETSDSDDTDVDIDDLFGDSE